jgi:hypothetical protein
VQGPKQAVGFEIGEWWYGYISRWMDFQLHVTWADPSRKIDDIQAEEVLWLGKPVLNWFTKEFYTTYRHMTKIGDSTLDVPFNHVTNLEIRGQEYPVSQLSCSAKGQFLKKRKYVTFSGRAFYDWHTGKITVPPGVQVVAQPSEHDLLRWDDYDGEIPSPSDPKDLVLMRGVFVLTQYVDGSLPVPDLELLTTGKRTGIVEPEPLKPGEFGLNHPFVLQALEEAGKTKKPPAG